VTYQSGALGALTMEKIGEHFAITGIALKLRARVPGIDSAKFAALADGATSGCPVSKALAAVPITLEAALA
jgi:osmotically inducible protein OsmC